MNRSETYDSRWRKVGAAEWGTWTPGLRWIPMMVLLAVLVLALSACSDDDASSNVTPTAALGEETPTVPAGVSCPVEAGICDVARRLTTILRAGDIEAFMALTEPVTATCPASGFGGPSPSLCAGVAPGQTRPGYWDVQGGEGLIVPEADFRRTLARWFESIQAAAGTDALGSGDFRVGSLSCARRPSDPAGNCSAGSIRAHFTFINSPTLDPARGTGLPGERTTVHVSMHVAADGMLKVDGFGQVVPPNSVLEASQFNYVDSNGQQVVLQFYPWTP